MSLTSIIEVILDEMWKHDFFIKIRHMTNNQQFLNNVVQCVDYIEHTTSDIYPVNVELLLAQAALESGWGTSRFATEGKNLLV